MKPIEYLRAKARQRKPATGGIVDPATVAALFAQANDRPQHMATEYKRPAPTPAAPAFLVEITSPRKPTNADVEQIRQQLQITPRPKPSRSEPLRCTCVAIYSEYRCPDTNISAQTNTADFHAEHQ